MAPEYLHPDGKTPKELKALILELSIHQLQVIIKINDNHSDDKIIHFVRKTYPPDASVTEEMILWKTTAIYTYNLSLQCTEESVFLIYGDTNLTKFTLNDIVTIVSKFNDGRNQFIYL
jgi:hypothetical protein